MGKNPFLEVEAANNARFAEFLKTRGSSRSEPVKASVKYWGPKTQLKMEGGCVTFVDREPLFGVNHRHLIKKDESVEKMQECVKLAAQHRHGVTGIDADALAATIDVAELLAAESPMAALEAALTAGEAKIRGEAQ